jgi:hypothetical protein
MGSPILAFASSLKTLETALTSTANSQEAINKAIASTKSNYDRFIKGENIASDKNILAHVLKAFVMEVEGYQIPFDDFYKRIKTNYGNINEELTYKRFSEAIFENSFILNETKWNAFIAKPDTGILKRDIAYITARAFADNYNNKCLPKFNEFNAKNYGFQNLYLKGILDMKKGSVLYPDANQTMRVSFGNVKSYSPKDGVKYSEVCTLSGVMEKYVPGDYEFDAPAKLIELINAKDYGQYVDTKTNDIVVSFITTNDITGGNSGSPVLNSNGELIGLAFDGNYEALSHKIAFDGELNRTICLDVRYLLFIVDKLGGAKNIIDELVLSKK